VATIAGRGTSLTEGLNSETQNSKLKTQMTANFERISVIIPVYNEEDYVETLIGSLGKQEYPRSEVELLFVDGGSTDQTIHRLKGLREGYLAGESMHELDFDPFRILLNPNKIVPHALNIGVKAATHDVIIRLDAHTEYAPDYFSQVVKTLAETGADIVGGPTRVASRSLFQKAVGTAICSRFAIGGSRVHQEDFRGETDSVTFGAWRRRVFEKAGGFDTRLVRNQDDEFHYRAKSLGFRLFQEPAIKLYYYPRDTPWGLLRQYYQYGKYKPLVLAKVKSEVKLRHLIPSAFVLYLLSLPLSILWVWWCIPVLIYLVAAFAFSIKNGATSGERCCLAIAYPLIHLGYGAGFLRGIPLALTASG
jgi:glycosyltransferase involved in cell wall biosynthesis